MIAFVHNRIAARRKAVHENNSSTVHFLVKVKFLTISNNVKEGLIKIDIAIVSSKRITLKPIGNKTLFKGTKYKWVKTQWVPNLRQRNE